jgi:hypothetical protein
VLIVVPNQIIVALAEKVDEDEKKQDKKLGKFVLP